VRCRRSSLFDAPDPLDPHGGELPGDTRLSAR
jgi:hypothetical protein